MKQVFVILVLLSNAQNEKLKLDIKQGIGSRVAYEDAKSKLKTAEKLYNKNQTAAFLEALPIYIELHERYPEKVGFAYKTGVCYLETYDKKAALPYLEYALKHDEKITDYLSWNLGRAAHFNHQFDDAISYFEDFKTYLQSEKASVKKVDQKIKDAKYAKTLVQSPVNVKISVPEAINSEYSDYCPLIVTDGSRMYFTSRSPVNNPPRIDPNDGLPFENIYTTEKKAKKWSKSENLGAPINNEFHNATVGLSPDGQSMIVYSQKDLFIATKEGDKWDLPKPFPPQINSADNESSASLSFNQKELFFIRGKEPGNPDSNADILVSEFENGQWSEPKKIPSTINTDKDEDGVFIHPDGKTLYFSSKGHQGMGGFDVFKSVREKDGNWSEPVNLGYPINTAADDLYFVMSADKNSAYYSSYREEGKGMLDIVFLDFKIETDSLIAQDTITIKPEKQEASLTLIKGIITDAKTKDYLAADIHIFDNMTGDSIISISSNSADGSYLIPLPAGVNYAMQVKKDGYVFHSENFNLPDTAQYHEEIINIALQPIQTDVKVVLRNIFFDLDKSELRPESYAELDRLKELLNENPDIRIEISGHTDTQGKYEYNKSLSLRRASAVRNYLIENGIAKTRIESRGASWDEPIADNETKDERQLNRRVEFKIID
jgi:outer membrane protein OmpA-like peptidoglycan-associated protein